MAIPGRTSGTKTLVKSWSSEAPSIRAALSKSEGSDLKKPLMIKTAAGSAPDE